MGEGEERRARERVELRRGRERLERQAGMYASHEGLEGGGWCWRGERKDGKQAGGVRSRNTEAEREEGKTVRGGAEDAPRDSSFLVSGSKKPCKT